MFIRTVLSLTLTKVIKQPQARRSRKYRCVAFCSRIYRRLDRHDSSSVTEDTVGDDTAWIQLIHNWKKQGEGVSERGWESDVLRLGDINLLELDPPTFFGRRRVDSTRI